jgi:hypothetical protein
VVDPGNIQRSANRAAETVLHVRRVGRGLALQRIGRGIQSRIADSVIDRTMRMIDVETAAPSNRLRAPGSATAKSSLPESAAAPEPTSVLASIINPLLQLVAAHRVKRIGIAGNRNRLGRAVRINSRNRHARGHHIAHRIAARVLRRRVLQRGKGLKAALRASWAVRPSRWRNHFVRAR